MAQQLCTHLPAPVPSAPCEQACSMVVAAGPFTPGDELDYTPLDDLLQYCSGVFCVSVCVHSLDQHFCDVLFAKVLLLRMQTCVPKTQCVFCSCVCCTHPTEPQSNYCNLYVPIAEKQPDLLVLLGPFVDAKHPSIENGNIDTTFEGLFREEVSCFKCFSRRDCLRVLLALSTLSPELEERKGISDLASISMHLSLCRIKRAACLCCSLTGLAASHGLEHTTPTHTHRSHALHTRCTSRTCVSHSFLRAA